jgi:hypothetical protein
MGETSEFTDVPATLDAALQPRWLSRALAPVGGGAAIVSVTRVEVIRTVATKVRFLATFEGEPKPRAFCLKGLLDVDEQAARGGPTCVREADFYGLIAPRIDVRTPTCVARVTDRKRQQAVIIMRDLIADGAYFSTAREPLTPDMAATSLQQIAHLHAASRLLDHAPWIARRIDDLAQPRYVTTAQLQGMLDGPRGEGLPTTVRSAERLVAGMRALAARDAARPQFLVHGDCHAGNLYQTAEGPGLIDWQLLQRGGFALDVAYHVAAVLPVDTAAREERRLLDHYLETARKLGLETPSPDDAWRQYRECVVYGYYLWSITRRVEPDIIALLAQRLGAAVARHDSFRLLGVDA